MFAPIDHEASLTTSQLKLFCLSCPLKRPLRKPRCRATAQRCSSWPVLPPPMPSSVFIASTLLHPRILHYGVETRSGVQTQEGVKASRCTEENHNLPLLQESQYKSCSV